MNANTGFEYSVIKRPYVRYWRIKVSRGSGVQVVVNSKSKTGEVEEFV